MCVKHTIDRYGPLDEEKQFEVRSKIKNFVRFYSYMAQIARTYDKELYKAYVYADYLYRLLPKDAKERIDLNIIQTFIAHAPRICTCVGR